MLTALAQNASVLLFGPPTPVSKDPPVQPSKCLFVSSPSPTPGSKSAILLEPNLGLMSNNAAQNKPQASNRELPLPPLPEQELSHSGSSTLLGLRASALSLVGNLVTALGSVAASTLTSVPSDADTFCEKPARSNARTATNVPSTTIAKMASYGSMLAAISNTILGHTGFIRNAALEAVS